MDKVIMPALTGRHYIAIAAVVIVILSWLGVLDSISDDYLNSSLVQATAAFASARALNAVISMLQGTEVSLLVLSLSVGDLLDPLDDLIEQYSTLMKYAIASLLMQKLLLLITSSTIFKVFLTLSGILAAGTAALGKEKLFSFWFRLFVFVAFIRFALVIVVGLNGAVGSLFINDQIDADVDHLQATAEVIEKTSSDNAMNTEVSDQLQGKSSSWFDGVVDSVGLAATSVKEKYTGRIDRAVQSMTEAVSNMLNLMAAFLLKTMILPLVFLYMMIMLTKMIWNVDLSRYVKS